MRLAARRAWLNERTMNVESSPPRPTDPFDDERCTELAYGVAQIGLARRRVLVGDGNPDSAHLRACLSLVAGRTREELLEGLCSGVHDIIPALSR